MVYCYANVSMEPEKGEASYAGSELAAPPSSVLARLCQSELAAFFELQAAELRWRAGRNQEALKHLHLAVQTLPESRPQRFKLWVTLFPGTRLAQITEFLCWALLREMKQKQPSSQTSTLFFVLISRSMRVMGRTKDRIANAEAYLFHAGPTAVGYRELAFALAYVGRRNAAVWAAERALALNCGSAKRLKAICGRVSSPYSFCDAKKTAQRYTRTGYARWFSQPFAANTATNPIPLFLCGFPKSGTTLLLSLLDSHPRILVFPEETGFFQLLRKRNRLNRWTAPSLHAFLGDTGVRHIFSGTVDDGGGGRSYDRINADEFELRVRLRWADLLQSRDLVPTKLLESIVFGFGDTIHHQSFQLWTEKTPYNEHYLSLAQKSWPNLKAIYIIRNPFDNYFSYKIKKQKDGRVLPAAAFSRLWCHSLNDWRAFSDANRQNTMLIRYEELTVNPVREMRRVAEFLGVAWSDTLLNPTRLGRPWYGNSQHIRKLVGVSGGTVGISRGKIALEESSEIAQSCEAELQRYYRDELGGGQLAFAGATNRQDAQKA